MYSKKKNSVTGDCDRRLNNTTTAADRTDDNLTDRTTKFQNIIKVDAVYRISLKFFVDLGLVSFPFKFNTKFVFTLEKNLNKLFETNLKTQTNAVPKDIDAEIIFHSAPYIQYEQFQLDDNFRTYLETALRTC